MITRLRRKEWIANLVSPTVFFLDNICVITLLVMKDCNWLLTLIEGRRWRLFFFFLRELISLVREVTQFKSAALTAAKQKWTVKVCFHLFLPHLFSSFWWHLFLDLTHFSPPKRVGVKGPRSLQKKMKKMSLAGFFFFLHQKHCKCVCASFACVETAFEEDADRLSQVNSMSLRLF